MLVPAAGLLALLGLAGAAAWASADSAAPYVPPAVLPTVRAIPVTTDTVLLGGFARGTFGEALRTLASDLLPSEREMIGHHLDKIFTPLLPEQGLTGGGRLRLAYERTRRPDGTTRSITVLAAQAAVSGELHTVFMFDQGKNPGYYDDWGRSLDPVPWAGPLAAMRVTSPFKMNRMHPILHRVLPHTGVDLAAAKGTPVYATADGSVSHAAMRGGYGLMVEVRHPNGLSTRYAHLSAIAVRPNAAVRQGDLVGYVGATGLATGPHLHYEVRRKGQPVDPMLVAATASSSGDVGYELAWRNERKALGRLLARAPTLVSTGRTISN
ncbi:MAG TPA: M23 family metallopeptidase [Longimicrobium sp.]|nr:M23 family metallopeptidase [Longimicrobium sp.]